MVKKIRKRDGSVVFFQCDKIESAIWKAARAVGGKDKERARVLTDKIVEKLDRIYGEHGIPDVEDVQDLVEKVLIEEGHAKVGKAYILYRKSRSELRDVKGLFDTIEAVEDYVGLNDWMVKENSNMGYSLQGLNNYIATKIISNYWMRRIYPEAVRKVHEAGDLHVHDLGTLGAYCVGWDLKDLLMTGFKGVKGKVESRPAKHLRTALGQMVNFFYTLQGETAGAQAFSNFDTYLAPFIRYDKLSYDDVKQAMQEFIFNLAVPTRVGFQTPFTNITMDLKVPGYLKDEYVIVGGELKMEKYGDFQKEMDLINRAFAEVMLEGDASGQVFTFPIPTYNITKDFDFDSPEYDLIWEMTAKYGIPNFSNYINSDMSPEDARSMCCRLRIDNTELRRRGGGLFGANPQTGSIGVVTINMARLGYVSTSEDDFMARLDRLMELSKESLEIKRKAIERFTDMGLYPYSKFYLRQVYERFGEHWKNHFGTIGLLGMNEAILNFMPGEDISTDKGHKFALKIMDFMRDRMVEYQEETGSLYNLEASPGEGTTYRFARVDKKRFGRIIVANEDSVREKGAAPYYTNSTQLPVGFTDDVFEALDLQDELQCKYTGGTNFHTFVGERMNVDAVKKLVKKIASNYKLPYFTITPTFSICPIHGYLAGEHEYCPKCDAEIAEARLAKEAVVSVSEPKTLDVSDEEIALAEFKPRVQEVAPVKTLKEVVDSPAQEKEKKKVSAFGEENVDIENKDGEVVGSFVVVKESKHKFGGDAND
jgi:anaerobic ribonucleoside-triphosphate reductase